MTFHKPIYTNCVIVCLMILYSMGFFSKGGKMGACWIWNKKKSKNDGGNVWNNLAGKFHLASVRKTRKAFLQNRHLKRTAVCVLSGQGCPRKLRSTLRTVSCDERQSNKVGNAISKIYGHFFCWRLMFQAIIQKNKSSKLTNTLQDHLIKYLILWMLKWHGDSK